MFLISSMKILSLCHEIGSSLATPAYIIKVIIWLARSISSLALFAESNFSF
jgi:hypothetical protein